MNVSIKRSRKQGKGVFADKNFSIGETILEIDDSNIVTDSSVLNREQHDFDLDYFDNKTVIMKIPEKYINHSCDPNTYVKTISGKRKVLAMKRIKKDEEVTYDYSINGDNEGSFKCNCGSKKCRKIYNGNFFKLPKNLQLSYIPYLDDWFKLKYKNKIRLLEK